MMKLSLLLVFITSVAFGGESSYRERRPGVILFEEKSDAVGERQVRLQSVMRKYGLKRKGRVLSSETLSKGSAGGLFSSFLNPMASGNLSQSSEEQMASDLMATGAVAYAEPDYRVYPIATTYNDPYLRYQWHHDRIRSYDAWEVSSGRSDVIVTVCDTGVDANHADLKANVIQPGYNTVDGSTRTTPVNSHGTAVAGLIGATRNNRIGLAGVAPLSRILPVRVSNSSNGGAYLSDLAECIRYGANYGAKVVNVSYTGANSSTIASAASYAASRGTLLVMAAGNSGADISRSHPDYTTFVLAGATTSADKRASFSNYGTPIDIVAPGASVATTMPNGGYSYISGTSFASPITAAVAALVFSVRPNLTPAAVQSVLYRSADYIGHSYYFGSGRVNASEAVKLATQ